MGADACVASTMTGDVRYTLEMASRPLETARCAGPRALAMSQAMFANALILSGRSREAERHLQASRQAFERDGLPPVPFLLQLVQPLGHSAMWVEENTEAWRFLSGIVSSARAQGAVRCLAFPLACLSEISYRNGRWTEAYAFATESEQIARDVGERDELSFSLVCRARVEVRAAGGPTLGDACHR